ncbi:spore gernimation protein [Paenibacillus sp. H1-7]|uniref:GerAB/ArcD/ProY family transporter n=1 Tax=Paenibacillus sp. H1-7 TaxID=2282849 RepID=UPI001EF79E40|nr:endospore germination permease [Paenibacillus sp. H1-7]ULL15062.1 spore gernimation protein [Paenibacillus sp. H1-7]
MRKETISVAQLSALFLISLTGSSIVNIPQPLIGASSNAAWISILLAYGLGLPALICILYLYRRYPGLTIVEILKQAIGPGWTAVIIIPFISMPLMLTANIVRDISAFFTTSMMRLTPDYVFDVLILMTAALTVKAGIEVMARMFILLIMVMFTFIIAVLLLVLPYYQPEFLTPLLPKGFNPVLHGAYMAFGVPYADVVLLTMLMPYVRTEKGKSPGASLHIALLLHTVGLLIVTVCTIMAFGPMAGDLRFSLFQIARMVSVESIFERVESIIGVSLIVGSFMKTTIVLFVLTRVAAQLFQFQDESIVTFPITLIVLLLALTMFRTDAEFRDNVAVVRPLMSFAVAYVPLVLITIAAMFKRKAR